jgi:hypothetical protein
VVDRYLNEEFRGKRIFFDFWEAEKEIFEWVMNYPHKKVIWKIIKGVKANSFMAYPYSVRHAKKNCMSATVPEVISHDEINLLTSKYFLGFYINGKVPRDIERILRNKFCGKIFFDGKRIRVMK